MSLCRNINAFTSNKIFFEIFRQYTSIFSKISLTSLFVIKIQRERNIMAADGSEQYDKSVKLLLIGDSGMYYKLNIFKEKKNIF